MTLSIAARCPDTGQFGVGAMTHMIGIGKIITHAGPGVGAVATQGEMNPYHGIDALARMGRGDGAREYPLWDIRIDQAEDPVAELRRMHDVFLEHVVPIIERLPKRAGSALSGVAGGS